MSVLVAPSILSADFARLGDEISRIERSADWVHVDVMDNHFVPNLTLGLPVVSRLAQISSLPLDCHLMIADPDRWAAGYAEVGAHNVTFHAEATDDPVQVARSIRAAGGLAGLAIKPGTGVEDYLPILAEVDTVLVMTVEPGFGGQAFMPETLPKVRALRAAITDASLQIRLEVDGGIDADTVGAAAEAGADVFVAGSAVYGATDPGAAIDALRRAADRIGSANGEGSGR